MNVREPQSKGLLTKGQLEVLKAFGNLPDADRFYLTGGTALAEFYLGHRRSLDLDLFTAEQGLIVPFSRIAEARFSQTGFLVKIIRRLENTPINLAYVYMRKEDANIVTDFFDPENDIYMIKVLERMTGKTNYTTQDSYEATLAVGETADRLQVPPGSPLMLVTRFVKDAHGYLLEAVQLFMRTDIQKLTLLLKKHIPKNVH